MKFLLIILTGTLVLTACNSDQKSATVISDSTTTARMPAPAESSATSDPFEKIKDFTIDFYSPEYEIFITALKKNKSLQVISNEGSNAPFKITWFRDNQRNSEFLVSEMNMGDEGFGIQQFYMENNALLKARLYAGTQGLTGKGFDVEEQILNFKTDKVEIKHRNKNVRSRNDVSNTLRDIPFKHPAGNKDELLEEYTNMFNQMKMSVKNR